MAAEIYGDTCCPLWITPALIHLTLEVWQKRSPVPLSEPDAVEILVAFGRLAKELCKTHDGITQANGGELIPHGSARKCKNSQ